MKINDITEKKLLFVERPVINVGDIVEYLDANNLIPHKPLSYHVTIVYSEFSKWVDKTPKTDLLYVKPSKFEIFNTQEDKKLLALLVDNQELHDRWQEFMDAGATWSFKEYKPHISLSLDPKIPEKMFNKEIILGPEKFKRLDKRFTY